MESQASISSDRSTQPTLEPVIIVGGGRAGLCCASVLQQSGTRWLLIEASDRLGGESFQRSGGPAVAGTQLVPASVVK